MDYKTAKATYAQVRKDTNYKLSPDANAREAARRLNVDLQTFKTVMATKKPSIPSPVTVPAAKVDYAKAKATYAQVRKDTKYKLSPLENRIEAARRLNISLDEFEKAMATKPVKKAVAKKATAKPKVTPVTPPQPLALDRWPRKRVAMSRADDAKATNPGWERKPRDPVDKDELTRLLNDTDEFSGVYSATRYGYYIELRVPDDYTARQLRAFLRKHDYEVHTPHAGWGGNTVMVTAKGHKIVKGTTKNCTSCTTTLELRMRGYDVVARTMPSGRSMHEVYSSWNAFRHQFVMPADQVMFQNWPNRIYDVTVSEFTKQALAMEVGARGFISTVWKAGGAHIYNWEIRMGKDPFTGNPKKELWFMDGQSGKEWPLWEDTYFDRAKRGEIEAVRVDLLPDPGDRVAHLTNDVNLGQTPAGYM